MAECAQSGVALYGNGFDELCKNDLHETRHISPMQSITFAATAGFGPFARSSTGTIIATAYALTISGCSVSRVSAAGYILHGCGFGRIISIYKRIERETYIAVAN